MAIGSHMIRYGIPADERYLIDFIETYDSIVINGNIAAYLAAALARFVGEKTVDKKGYKPFFIDPLTHAFQHSADTLKNRDGKVKASIRKMAERYDLHVSETEINHGQALTPDYFKDTGVRRKFCESVLRFQKEVINENVVEQDFSKYLEYVLGKIDFVPEVLIAPYFLMKRSTQEFWLGHNLDFVHLSVHISKDISPDTPVFAQLVISRDMVENETCRGEIVKQYGDSPCDGVLIWIDNFSEFDAGEEALRSYSLLVKGLKQKGKEVFNLYGSYFSTLLTKLFDSFRLDGVCHGLEYGEYREVVPVGGGIPLPRFYYPQLHKRLKYAQALRALRTKGYLKDAKTYLSKVCKCPTCKSTLDEDVGNFTKYGETKDVPIKRDGRIIYMRQFAEKETKDICLRHYLSNKYREFEESPDSVGRILAEFESLYKEYAPILALDEVVYLKTWTRVIRQLRDEDK